MPNYRVILDITANIKAKSKKEVLEKLKTEILDDFMISNIIKIEMSK